MTNTSPGLFTGQVPTAAQWNSYFSGKVDAVSGAMTSPTMTSPTITGGTLSGTFAGSPVFNGTVGFSGNAEFYGSQSWTFTKSDLTNANLAYLSGTQTVNSATITGAFAPINILQIYDLGISVPSGTATGLYIQMHAGGAAVTGGVQGFQVDMDIDATTGNTGGQYGAIQGNFQSAITDASGIGYGANFTAQLQSGASGWDQVVGQENNVGVQTGATAPHTVTGLQVVPFGDWTVAGTDGNDSAYVIGFQPGAVGFDTGFRITGIGSGFPIKTTGTLFNVTTSGTIVDGFNVSNLTFTGHAFKSIGFLVDGSGNIIAPSIGNGSSPFQISGSGAFTANGTVGTTMTSLGPTGSNTTVQEWFTITNANGVVRYIPAY